MKPAQIAAMFAAGLIAVAPTVAVCLILARVM